MARTRSMFFAEALHGCGPLGLIRTDVEVGGPVVEHGFTAVALIVL